MKNGTVPTSNEVLTLGDQRKIISGSTALQLEAWERHLRDCYRLPMDCGKLVVPILPTGKFRRPALGVSTDRLTLNQRYDVCASFFPCFRYTDDLDAGHKSSQKRPAGDYVFWYEGAIEASEENSNLTPDQLDERNLIYLTIGERLVIEPFHWEQTGGGHLDLVNWDITSSRHSDGHAFDANWNDRQFEVNWWNRDNANPNGRFRETVLSSGQKGGSKSGPLFCL